MSLLSERLNSGEFVYTGEIGPPKGTCLDDVYKKAEIYKGLVSAVNVTDNQSAVMRMCSMSVSKLLLDFGLEPIFQMTCRDRNRLALQSDLLGAYALGLRNLLVVSGDHVALGDHPQAKPVFGLGSVSLLHAVSELEKGRDLAGNELHGAPQMFKGAVVSPYSEPVEMQVIKMEQKAAAGAQFFQTQAVFTPARFESFVKKAAHVKLPVLAGVVLLKSAAMAKFMNKNIPGIDVPENLIKELDSVDKDKRKKKSAEIAVRIIRAIKGMCAGVHIMSLGWDELVPDIIDQTR